MNTSNLTKYIVETLALLDEKMKKKHKFASEISGKVAFLRDLSPDTPLTQEYTDTVLRLCEEYRGLINDVVRLEGQLAHLKKLREEQQS